MVQSKSDICQRLSRPLLISIRKSANRSIWICPARCMVKLQRGCTHSEYDNIIRMRRFTDNFLRS
jgi:hypothetical protein